MRAEARVQIRPVPVHIHRGDGQRNILCLKAVHELFVFRLRILPVTAPPHAERKARNNRHRAADLIKITDAVTIGTAVCKNIIVAPVPGARCEFSVFI